MDNVCTSMEVCTCLLSIADVAVVHKHGALVGISNHGIGNLTGCTEAQPVALPSVVKLHTGTSAQHCMAQVAAWHRL